MNQLRKHYEKPIAYVSKVHNYVSGLRTPMSLTTCDRIRKIKIHIGFHV